MTNKMDLKRIYEDSFNASEEYLKTLPDMQNTTQKHIKGSNIAICQVGMNNFKMPLKFLSKDGKEKVLETSILGTVSLEGEKKGINMSRILRSFYEFEDRVFTPELLEEILLKLKQELKSLKAKLVLKFSYPILQKSLRSNLEGWQYYSCQYEGLLDENNQFKKIIKFDFIYSSACPCSSELSEHARHCRQIYSIPHSQRSKVRVTVQVKNDKVLYIEDLQQLCLDALNTETQVMAKRQDEQAFAELNGSYVKFVEDAARLVYTSFDENDAIKDFEAAFVHLESLHSHDAVAVITKNIQGGFTGDFDNFSSMIC